MGRGDFSNLEGISCAKLQRSSPDPRLFVKKPGIFSPAIARFLILLKRA